MSVSRTTLARVVSGLLSLALLGALLFTVVRGRGSIADAEAAAQERAARWVSTTLADALTPERVASEILGPAYRELLIVVQAGILADDRVARVRIWSPDGVLVFSSDQRDKIGEYVAENDPHIQAALGGEVVSLPTEATLGPKAGLAGADEKLFQTFVPLHLAGETATSGVVQIDQRYQAIEGEASGSWGGVRLGLVAALTASLLWFLFALRRPALPVAEVAEAATGAARSEEAAAAVVRAERADAEAAAATERVRELEARMLAAEERAARAEADLAEALSRSTQGPEEAAAIRLQELEDERQRLAGELARVRAALAERDAELALARERERAGGDEAGRVAELEAELESTRGELSTTRAELEATRGELAKVRERVEARAAEGSATLRAAEERAAAAEAERAELSAQVQQLAAELETTRAELETTRSDLAEARAQLSAGVSAVAEGPVDDVEAFRVRIEELEAARRTDIAELQRAQEALANTQYEAAQALRRAKELERELAVLREAVPEGAAAPEAPQEERPTIGERLAALARERASTPSPTPAPTPAGAEIPSEQPAERPGAEPEPTPEPTEEGLSLRERLARAAAARHRAPGKETEREG